MITSFDLNVLREQILNEYIKPQLNLENLGFNYLEQYDYSVTEDIYDYILHWINKFYIQINENMFIFEDLEKKKFFSETLYELFYVKIPKTDIHEYKEYIYDDNFKDILIQYYINEANKFYELKLNNQVLKSSIAAIIFDCDIENIKLKYFVSLI